MTNPSVGRTVHYVSFGTPGGEFQSQCRAAVITEVDPEEPGLIGAAVLNPTGLFFQQDLPYSEEPRGGTWHWPERVDER